MTLRTVDLFAGCGAMSLGFQQASFEIAAAFDNWLPAIDVYRKNFDHPIINLDLRAKASIDKIVSYGPEVIIGGPPCQDFSIAGHRDESKGRANLTISFANVIKSARPKYFVMENVYNIERSRILPRVISLLRSAGYGLTGSTLDSSYFGVPQARRRFILIGKLGGQDGEFFFHLDKRKRKKRTTVFDYLGDSLGLQHYYVHPRNYKRRAIFSIHEPSSTVRGVNRPMPLNYQMHNGDSARPSKKIRALTSKERSFIQTFPKSFKFDGTKSQVDQMIGNAVPVLLARAVADCILKSEF